MPKAKRVFQVAKELGVSSKAIVSKCQAEVVPDITNHMSTVKVGLEATIREWFGDSNVSVTTAVETAEKVDMTKARRGVRRRAKSTVTLQDVVAKATAKAKPLVASPTPTGATEAKSPIASEPIQVDPPAESEEVTQGQIETETEAVPAKGGPTAHSPAKPPPLEPVSAPDEVVEPVEPDSSTQPVGQPNVPERPVVIKPAGEQLSQPKQAVLKGPQVVRVEQADSVEPPRPRRTVRPAGQVPSEAGSGAVPEITRSRGPARGRGAGEEPDRGPGGKAGQKRRSLTTRRGRSADAQLTGPSKFSEQDLIELDARLRGAPGFLKQRRRDLKRSLVPGQAATTPAEIGGTVEIAEPVTIKELSAATGIKSSDVIKYLFKKGVMATINSAIDTEAAMEVALEYDIELVVREQQTAEQQVIEEFENREAIDLQSRPPVVAVLGHVDHGKTSLLDRIRQADVASQEAGGITQHVGAYRVTINGHDSQEQTVVFLDTPGHEAFTSMRARGANMTDLVVLVVAADDGVMPQTIESINHAKAAKVRMIVALNKIDRPEATDENIRKIFGQLSEHGLNPVEWGGEVEVIKTSAETGDGVTDLLEVLDYQAKLLELQADFGGPARGTVIEAEMQEGRGPVARVLVQQGRIAVGDFIVIGRAFGRVRDMTDDRGVRTREAGPATPLEISGIDLVPDAGDKFYITGTLHKAEDVANQCRDAERQQQLANKTKVTLDNFAATLEAGSVKDLRVVLKADVQGSLDVLTKSLNELGNNEVAVRVIHAAVGGINESDVLLAEASEAVIIGFHVVTAQHARDLAERRRVDIRLYRVIYDVTDEVTKALEGMLDPETKEEIVGTAELRQVFKIGKMGLIAGCLVTEGAVRRKSKIRVIRDDVVITDNRAIESLRRVKEDVNEVRAGTECGIRVAGFDDLKPDDRLVCYNVVTVARKLEGQVAAASG